MHHQLPTNNQSPTPARQAGLRLRRTAGAVHFSVNPALPMPEAPPVSLRDIARRAEVSIMTVSLALREDPRISAPTRARVARIARELGYKRDPLLSAYGQQIRRRRSQAFHSTLAWFHDWERGDAYLKAPWLKRYWEGAQARARQLGFVLDPIWLRQNSMSPKRLHEILQNRGIRGFIVHQLLHPEFFEDFPLGEYATASIGQNLLSSRVPRVLPEANANALIVLEQLVARGYRRIGYFQNIYHTTKTQAEGLCAWHFHAPRLTGGPQPPPFFTTGNTPEPAACRAFVHWYREHRPDAILTENDDLLEFLRRAGARVPQDVGVAHLEITDARRNWAGIDPLPEALGAAALDLLAGQLFRNEPGARHAHESVRITGRWREGATLRPLPEGVPPPPAPPYSYGYFRESLAGAPHAPS